MEQLRTLREASKTDGIWGTLARLLALDSSTGAGLPGEFASGRRRISAGWSQEVLGEWLWLHNSAAPRALS